MTSPFWLSNFLSRRVVDRGSVCRQFKLFRLFKLYFIRTIILLSTWACERV